jgi:hypothetical protein
MSISGKSTAYEGISVNLGVIGGGQSVGSDVGSCMSAHPDCHPDNLAPMGVMKKLGMHPRGLENWYSQTVASDEIAVDTWRSAAFQRKS